MLQLMDTRWSPISFPSFSLRQPHRNRRLRWYSIWPCLLALPTRAFVLHPNKLTARKARLCPAEIYVTQQDKNFHALADRLREKSKLFVSNDGEIKSQETSGYVWIWENDSILDGHGTWKQPDGDNSTAKEVTTLVTNWCENFVVELDLCPWAKTSLQTRGAMRFFLVPSPHTIDDPNNSMEMVQEEQERWMDGIVENVAERFQEEILKPTTCNDDTPSAQLEKAAIYFVVFLPNDSESLLPNSFIDFSYWFMDMEEDWKEEYDNVIVAPFHPSWSFGQEDVEDGNDFIEQCLDYEKRSPYPLVTLVSTQVVEKAGAAVTEAIGEHNEEVLVGIEEKHKSKSTKKSHVNASVGELWRSAVYGSTRIKT